MEYESFLARSRSSTDARAEKGSLNIPKSVACCDEGAKEEGRRVGGESGQGDSWEQAVSILLHSQNVS